MKVQVLDDAAALADQAARLFIEAASNAIRLRGGFSVALAGGSTPLRLYDILARDPCLSAMDWEKTHLFWGDERCVPPVSADSNFRQVQEHLLSKIKIPVGSFHRILGELGADRAAALYEQELRLYFGNNPVFDLILLGMGPDGHTASLFPGTAALEDKQKWVVGVPHSTPPPPQVDRVSLSLPVINAARQVVFLVAGSGKGEIMAQVMDAHPREPMLPAQRVKPLHGSLTWLVEKSVLEE